MLCRYCRVRRALNDSRLCFDCKFPEPEHAPEKRMMPCLGQLWDNCYGVFLTTPERRICPKCTQALEETNLRGGVEQRTLNNCRRVKAARREG